MQAAWTPRRSSWTLAARDLRTALEGAVTARVAAARVVTADCSGGLDSTSLCLLAGRHAPVIAITMHPAGVDHGGDLDYARAAVAARPRHPAAGAGPPAWLSVPARPPTRTQSASVGLGLPAADLQILTEIRAVGRTARADAQIAQSYGIDLHNPYCDGQVIDAALTVPAWKRGSARRYKPLLAAALGHVIPQALGTRVTKGVFEADHHRGLRTHLSHILALADRWTTVHAEATA